MTTIPVSKKICFNCIIWRSYEPPLKNRIEVDSRLRVTLYCKHTKQEMSAEDTCSKFIVSGSGRKGRDQLEKEHYVFVKEKWEYNNLLDSNMV